MPRPSLGLTRRLNTSSRLRNARPTIDNSEDDAPPSTEQEHAIISAFDLFSIGIGPSSSHTVGPMRAGNIFVTDLVGARLLSKVARLRVAIYGSLALTGEGHMTPSALLLGLEGANIETVDTAYVPDRFMQIKSGKRLRLGNGDEVHEIDFDYGRDFVWQWSKKLPLHSNGMRFSAFDENGDPLATKDLYSVGGGFVVNGTLSLGPAEASTEKAISDHNEDGPPAALSENLYYKEINKEDAAQERRTASDLTVPTAESGLPQPQEPSRDLSVDQAKTATDQHTGVPYPFRTGNDLLRLCRKHNLTIAQLMYENEKGLGLTDDEIFDKLYRLWDTMDNCIREGVQAPLNTTLPGSLKLRRRAPALYAKLTKGLYPEHTQVQHPRHAQRQLRLPSEASPTDLATTSSDEKALDRTAGSTIQRRRQRSPPHYHGSATHPISVSPLRSATLPAMDYLTVYAIAVNETNAAGGRVVTAPTNGAAGIIPAVLKYVVEFVSDDPDRDIPAFLLTAAAIASLFKRGATISAAEGGCMAEVGVACSMAAAAYAACMGARPETIEQAAEIGIEHNLGLTCDPVGGLVQAPCIERNALGAIKAVSSANLALNSEVGLQKVTLDDAIRAMRLTARGMKDEFKETSLSGLATTVAFNIPVSVPDC